MKSEKPNNALNNSTEHPSPSNETAFSKENAPESVCEGNNINNIELAASLSDENETLNLMSVDEFLKQTKILKEINIKSLYIIDISKTHQEEDVVVVSKTLDSMSFEIPKAAIKSIYPINSAYNGNPKKALVSIIFNKPFQCLEHTYEQLSNNYYSMYPKTVNTMLFSKNPISFPTQRTDGGITCFDPLEFELKDIKSPGDLLYWACNKLAGGFVSALGGKIFEFVFNLLFGDGKDLAWYFNQQLEKIRSIVREELEQRDWVVTMEKLNSLMRLMSQYHNVPTNLQLLEQLRVLSNEIVGEIHRFGKKGMKPFSVACSLHMTVLAALIGTASPSEKSGAIKNIKDFFDYFFVPQIGHFNVDWQHWVTEPFDTVSVNGSYIYTSVQVDDSVFSPIQGLYSKTDAMGIARSTVNQILNNFGWKSQGGYYLLQKLNYPYSPDAYNNVAKTRAKTTDELWKLFGPEIYHRVDENINIWKNQLGTI